MAAFVGVTFGKLGKLRYYPVPAGWELQPGDLIVVEGEHGDECGEVKLVREAQGDESDAPHGYRLLRLATESDKKTLTRRAEAARRAAARIQEKATALKLPMKVLEAELSLSGERLTCYFLSDERIDFRQLVREAAAALKMRIHLHQLGARDHARALGGYGPCGRPLCCSTFLRDFAPVTMKMAKDQSLYLNPSKYSGACGKLMCCLRYEHDTYLEARERLPQPGASVACHDDGAKGTVVDVDPIRECLRVRFTGEDGWRTVTLPVARVSVVRACGDCGAESGGCGESCGSGGCGEKLIALERRNAR